MDFSFEKTNSAYMLFYERIPKQRDTSDAGSVSSQPRASETISRPPSTSTSAASPDSREDGVESTATGEDQLPQEDVRPKVQLSKELADVSKTVKSESIIPSV